MKPVHDVCFLTPLTASYSMNSVCFKALCLILMSVVWLYVYMSLLPSSELFLSAGMLEYDPVKRFSIQRIRQHKWVHQCRILNACEPRDSSGQIEHSASRPRLNIDDRSEGSGLITTYTALQKNSDVINIWSAVVLFISRCEMIRNTVCVQNLSEIFRVEAVCDAGAPWLDERREPRVGGRGSGE